MKYCKNCINKIDCRKKLQFIFSCEGKVGISFCSEGVYFFADLEECAKIKENLYPSIFFEINTYSAICETTRQNRNLVFPEVFNEENWMKLENFLMDKKITVTSSCKYYFERMVEE